MPKHSDQNCLELVKNLLKVTKEGAGEFGENVARETKKLAGKTADALKKFSEK